MQETLAELCEESLENQDEPPGSSGSEATRRRDPSADYARCTVAQYSCLLASERISNLEGIARARLEKPQKRRDLDAQVHEEYSKLATMGENPEDMPYGNPDDDVAGTSSAADVPKQVFPPIRHKPNEDEQRMLLQFQMRSRNSAFAKEFMSLPLFQTDIFQTAVAQSTTSVLGRAKVACLREITNKFATMFTQERRKLLSDHQTKINVQNAEDLENDAFSLDDARIFLHKMLPDIPADCCAFSEQGVYATPSALIKDLVRKLPETQRLNEDQTLFMARFAQVCDQAYEDRTKPPKERRVHHLLLLGQGGSGKTHVVQNLVFVAVLFIWPPTHGETLHVVAASNAQAKNISTAEVKARTLHSATCMRVQKMVNSRMAAGTKDTLLQERWQHAMVLIIEEISMVSASLYNMLDWRIMLGRKLGHDVSETTYSRIGCAFGRIPIIIHLGDFLQLKPTGQMSLVDDVETKLPDGSWKYPNVTPEIQHAQELFCNVPDVFELRGTMRFVRGDPIIAFLQCMRTGGTFPAEVWTAFESTFAKDTPDSPDPRHLETRFAEGFGMGIYWESLSRMISRRAVIDAHKCGVPLLLVQCADECNDMDKNVAFRFLNQLNPHNTGHMHGILPVHVGMRLRLLAKFNADLGLVQETCCTVVDFELHEHDRNRYGHCRPGELFHPHFLPAGLWVSVDNYDKCPIWQTFMDEFHDGSNEFDDVGPGPSLSLSRTVMLEKLAKSMWLLPAMEATVNFSSTRNYDIRRCGFQASHANFMTSTSSQGQTIRTGVTIDCARLPPTGATNGMDDDVWWLHLYVMFSRATRMCDMLLLRPPPRELLERGPPANVRKQMQRFANRADVCRQGAIQIARDLGMLQACSVTEAVR